MTDVITIIENDHREIERLFEAYRTGSAAGPDDAIDELRVALSHHAAAEELLVYPAVRRATSFGDEQADEAIDEHQEIKRLLAEVDDLTSGDVAMSAKVAELERSVAEHVEEEESVVLPSLRAGMDAERLDRMGELFDAIKPLLPTRPHPLVPGTATAQLLAGPLASVADRISDLVER